MDSDTLQLMVENNRKLHNILRLANTTEQIANDCVVTVHQQNERIERIQNNIERIRHNIRETEKRIGKIGHARTDMILENAKVMDTDVELVKDEVMIVDKVDLDIDIDHSKIINDINIRLNRLNSMSVDVCGQLMINDEKMDSIDVVVSELV